VGKLKLFRRDEDFLADRLVSPLHFKKNSVTARNVARLAGQARSAAPLWEEPAFAEAERSERERGRSGVAKNHAKSNLRGDGREKKYQKRSQR